MSNSGSMPTSGQGTPYCMPSSIFEEILLSVFSGSMDNNRQLGIVIVGPSVLLLMSPWIYKSPCSKATPELNLDSVWTHKVTGLANNCRPTFMDALPLSQSTILIWSPTDFCGCNREKKWTNTFICHQIKAYSSAAISLLRKVRRPKQVKKPNQTRNLLSCKL